MCATGACKLSEEEKSKMLTQDFTAMMMLLKSKNKSKIMEKKMKKLMGIVIGALLICCGVLFVLNIFGILKINFSVDGWWTLFIILPCLCGLITNKDKFGSLIGLSVGVLLLLAARNVFDYNMIWKIIIPIIIVLLGVKLIIKSINTKENSSIENSAIEQNGEQKDVMAVFTEKNVDYSEEELSVVKIGAVFGGASVNLKNAKIVDGSHIDLLCAFGGVDIFLPENVIIKNDSFCLFGGLSDKRNVINQNENNITLYINGFCLFGGIDIK